jgi:hypothetical protein
MYILIATAKLNSVDPQAWLADVLRRIADHPAARAAPLALEAARNPSSCRLTTRPSRPSPEAYGFSHFTRLNAHERRTSCSSHENRLRAITASCEARFSATQFLLESPVLVALDGDWTNFNSWRMARRF